MADEIRYSVGELAELGGVSRRTVRYYVQEGLMPTPYGLGRGAHYGPEHLDLLLRVKSMQEEGSSLDAIRLALAGDEPAEAVAPLVPLVPRSRWTRVELMPGVELQLSSRRRVPSPRKLQELIEWCHRNFQHDEEEDND
jgi:DNA-binding transcriptional MerR regulator